MNLRIRDLREDRDIKQWEIARFLDCDPSLYSKYERGERIFPLEYAVKLGELATVKIENMRKAGAAWA